MSDLKTELKDKVLPVLAQGNGRLSGAELTEWDNEEKSRTGEEMTPVTNTDRLYNSVKNNPGKGWRFYVEDLRDVKESSVSSLLTQLRTGGWLRSEGARGAMVFFPTDKKRIARAAVPEHLLAALNKARATRSENIRKRNEAKVKAAKKEAKKAVKIPRDIVVSSARDLLEKTREQLGQGAARHEAQLHESFARTLRTVTAGQLIDALGVRVAKGLYDELKSIFG